MWSRVVIIGPPASERDAGLGQRREQRLVQQFIPQPTVEALDEGILHGLARGDVVPCDAALVGPGRDGVVGELAAVVAHAATADGFTRPPVAHPVGIDEMFDSFPPGRGRHHFFPQRRVVQHGVGQRPFPHVFSSSSVFSRLASETSSPPKLAFHL